MMESSVYAIDHFGCEEISFFVPPGSHEADEQNHQLKACDLILTFAFIDLIFRVTTVSY